MLVFTSTDGEDATEVGILIFADGPCARSSSLRSHFSLRHEPAPRCHSRFQFDTVRLGSVPTALEADANINSATVNGDLVYAHENKPIYPALPEVRLIDWNTPPYC